MNPFLFKAHPLLQATIGCLTGETACDARVVLRLLAIYLAINLPLTALLIYRARRALHIRLRFGVACVLAFPATVLYLPVLLTLLGDVLQHAFRIEDRVIFLFALGVATVLLAALYGVVVHDRNGETIGSESGLLLVLTLLLACVPYGLLLLAVEPLLGILPTVQRVG